MGTFHYLCLSTFHKAFENRSRIKRVVQCEAESEEQFKERLVNKIRCHTVEI